MVIKRKKLLELVVLLLEKGFTKILRKWDTGNSWCRDNNLYVIDLYTAPCINDHIPSSSYFISMWYQCLDHGKAMYDSVTLIMVKLCMEAWHWSWQSYVWKRDTDHGKAMYGSVTLINFLTYIV